MSIYKGNTKLGNIAFGNTEMQMIYIGSTQIFQRVPANLPYLIFEFSDSGVTATSRKFSHGHGNWERVSTTPNRWKWSCEAFIHDNTRALGWVAVFSSTDSAGNPTLVPSNMNGGTCAIVEAGGDFTSIESTDRLFYGCTAITSFCHIPLINGVIANTSGMFKNCSGLGNHDAGQFYAFLSGDTSQFQPMTGVTPLTSIPGNHGETFSGITPIADLDYIPTGWGGNQMPPSVSLSTALESVKASWKINAGVLDPIAAAASQGQDINLFTASSISSYAGVKMARDRLYNKINGFSNATSADLYYRPCFVQMPGIPNTNTTYQPTWILTTTGINGHLGPNASATDMPGTLDNSLYGPMDLEYGTYDSSSQAKFAILVTNQDPSNWSGLTDGMAFCYNSNFKADAGLNYYIV